MQFKYKHIVRAMACISIILSPSLASAGDVGTITVTAERQSSSVRESARPVTVIDRQSIEKSHASNVVDLLRGRANIVVRDTSGIGAKSQVDLGGFGETAAANSVVLIDGRPVNSSDLSGVDWTQIPVDSIERIEIIHGGGSVLYGAGAVGGVINLITRVPESGGVVSASAGSFGSYQGGVRIGSDAGRVRSEVRVSGKRSDGYRDNGFVDFADAGGRAEVDVSDRVQLYVRGNHHRDRIGQPGSLTAAQIAANRQQTTTPNDVSKTLDSYIEGGALVGLFEGVELDLPATFRRRESDALFSGFRVQSTLRTMNLRPRLSLSYASAFNMRAILGADIERGKGTLSSFNYKRTHNGYYGHVSVSADDKLWVLSGGARSERLDDRFVSGTTFSNLAQNKTTWEFGGVLNISPLLGLHVSAASSVRFPLLDERFNFTSKTIVTTLLPQTGKHYGISTHSQWHDVSLDLSFNRADLSKEIFFNPTSFSNANYANKTRHDVWMIQSEWKAADWANLRASYTYARASFRGGTFDGKTIPAVPKQRFGMAVDSEWGHGFGTTLDLSYVGNSFLISDQGNTATRLPAYLVANLVARYRWHQMDTFLRIDNLSNRKYSRYGVHSAFSGDKTYPAPTVSAFAGINYRF